MSDREPLLYRIAHIRASLLADPHLVDQAVELEASEGRIIIRGEVATPSRRLGIIALVTQLAPDLDIVDDLCVSRLPPEDESETEIL